MFRFEDPVKPGEESRGRKGSLNRILKTSQSESGAEKLKNIEEEKEACKALRSDGSLSTSFDGSAKSVLDRGGARGLEG